jgi:type 1 fimbria pilin
MVSLKLPALVLAFMTTMVASKPFNPNGPGVVKDKQCTIVKPDNDYVVKDGGFKQTGFSFQGNSNAAFTSYIDGDEVSTHILVVCTLLS